MRFRSIHPLLNRDILRGIDFRLCLNLRDVDLQNTVVELSFDVFLFDIFAYIEGSLKGANVALAADKVRLVLAIVLLVFSSCLLSSLQWSDNHPSEKR